VCSRITCEPAHRVDQLVVRGAGRIAKFRDGMGIGKFAQVDQLADPLSPVELQLGRTVGEENAPQLALAGSAAATARQA
jgi:hypothetical protein